MTPVTGPLSLGRAKFGFDIYTGFFLPTNLPAKMHAAGRLLGLNNDASIEASGSLADGMLPKSAAIDAALANGVQRVHVISYKLADSILLEVFTNEGTGTLVVDDIAALTPAEQGDGS